MAIEEHPDGGTPLDPDEAEGLIPEHITTREQLNEWEAENVLEGERWAITVKRKDILDSRFVRDLHRQLFGRTWKWAGKFRNTEKNIGVAPERIAVDLHNLLEDVKVQLESKRLALDEIAVRFHHRLVFIHPFPNGNGRHARLMTDLLLIRKGAKPFTWGRGDLVNPTEVRDRYLAALQKADKGDLTALEEFVRSGGNGQD